MKTVITYGTFDLFHVGHVNLLKRAREFGDQLIVGVSTDEFNLKQKSKTSLFPFEQRVTMLEACKYVDKVIPETSWDQKEKNIKEYSVSVFVIGNDWEGKFDNLKSLCDVVYLKRTQNISSTEIKKAMLILEQINKEFNS